MNKRKNYIDIAKGISIIAIVLLHYEEGLIPKSLNTWIGSFMIVTFYFTSGWILALSSNKLTVKELVKKRISSLVIPYLWFSLLLILFDILLVVLGFKESKLVLIDLYKTITLRGIGTLWFLPALFGGEIIFIFLRDKNILKKIITICVTIGYFLIYYTWSNSMGHLSEIYRIIDAPFRTIYNIMNAWIVIAAGYYICKRYGIAIQKASKSNFFLLMSAFFVLSFIATTLSAYVPKILYASTIQPFFVSIICPFSILLFSMLTERLIVNKLFIFWGKNSLILMATHYSIFMVLFLMLNKYLTGSDEFIGINAIYYFIITMLLQYPVVFFINSKAKFLLGK